MPPVRTSSAPALYWPDSPRPTQKSGHGRPPLFIKPNTRYHSRDHIRNFLTPVPVLLSWKSELLTLTLTLIELLSWKSELKAQKQKEIRTRAELQTTEKTTFEDREREKVTSELLLTLALILVPTLAPTLAHLGRPKPTRKRPTRERKEKPLMPCGGGLSSIQGR